MEDASPTSLLVVGAGPVGLALAVLAARQGLSVRVLERHAATGGEPRAVMLDDEAMRALQSVGLHRAVAAVAMPGYGSRYYARAADVARGRPPFAEVAPSAETYGFPRRNRFHQPELEALLEGAARDAGVDLRFRTAMAGFADRGDHVRVDATGPDGAPLAFRARWLVGCDGGQSPVRQRLGVRLEGSTYAQRWLVVDLRDDPRETRFTEFLCDPARPAVSVPGPGGRRRYEVMLFPGEAEADFLSDAAILRHLAPFGYARLPAVERRTVYAFHARVAARWRVGRVFLAGDAAHLMPPFAGQGLNSGLRDAANLAWKLALGGDALLDTYEAERRPHAAAMVRLSVNLGRVVMTPSRPAALLRDALLGIARRLPGGERAIRQQVFKPQPSYAAGAFVPGDAPPGVGAMLPQPRVAGAAPCGGDALLDSLLPGPGFALLGVGVAPDAPLPGGLEARLRPARAALALPGGAAPPGAWPLAPGEAAGRLRAHAGRLLLLRPDRFLAASARPEGLAALAPRLAAVFGGGPP